MTTTTIFYFTGTGNSLKVAKDIKDKLEDVELVRINKDFSNITEKLSERIGIVFPVYYYGLPAMVSEFIKKIEVSPNTYIFSIATCGGSVGVAMKQVERLLSDKELKLSAAYKIQMPDNFQVMYEPPSENKQKQYFINQEGLMDEIVDVIAKKQYKKFYEKGKQVSKILGGALSSTFNPKEKDRNFWIDEKCNGCGSCAKLCPANNIEMKNGKPTWVHQCEFCLGCMQWCPKKSIQYKKGTVKRTRYHHPQIKISELYEK